MCLRVIAYVCVIFFAYLSVCACNDWLWHRVNYGWWWRLRQRRRRRAAAAAAAAATFSFLVAVQIYVKMHISA